MFQLLIRACCFSMYPWDGGMLNAWALKRWCRREKIMWPCTVYLTKLGCGSSFFFFFKSSSGVFFFSFFLSGFSDSMCAFLLCYWLCCKQSSKQNWFMIHFAAIQTASSEVTKKFCFCTHLINETQRKTRQNRTPTWSDGMPNIKCSSQNPRCSSFSYHMSIICLFSISPPPPPARNLSFKEQKE